MPQKPARTANRWTIFSLLWLAASIYALFFKSGGGTPPFAHFDKFAHCALFFGQFWLITRALRTAGRRIPYAALFAAGIVWAATSELIQAFCTDSRSGDIWDAAADTAGIVLALIAARIAEKAQQNTRAA